MSVSIGGTAVDAIYTGVTEVDEIRIGDTLYYQKTNVPVIQRFVADHQSWLRTHRPSRSVLSWDQLNGTSATVDAYPGGRQTLQSPTSNLLVVSPVPTVDTRYVLTVTNTSGSAQDELTLSVDEAPPTISNFRVASHYHYQNPLLPTVVIEKVVLEATITGKPWPDISMSPYDAQHFSGTPQRATNRNTGVMSVTVHKNGVLGTPNPNTVTYTLTTTNTRGTATDTVDVNWRY